jgi:hypothetical protein
MHIPCSELAAGQIFDLCFGHLPDMPAPMMITVALVKSLFPTGRRVLVGGDILPVIERRRGCKEGCRTRGDNP